MQIDCPRARTFMTPCIARDGRLALADTSVCVGCGGGPRTLLADLAGRFPAAAGHDGGTAEERADALSRLVAVYVSGQG